MQSADIIIFRDIFRSLRQAQVVHLISHLNPDPDALGSQLGLYHILRHYGLTVEVFNESPIPESLRFFPGWELLQHKPPAKRVPDVAPMRPNEPANEVIVVLDCGSRERVGELFADWVQGSQMVVNIDHHISNTLFGDLKLVKPSASSTSELVFEFAEANGLDIPPEAALCLFAGLAGDTGSFRYQSTFPRTLEIAGKLVERGANPAEISTSIFGETPREAVRLQADALLRATFLADGRVAMVTLTADDYARFNASPEHVEGLVERLRDIRGVKVALAAKFDHDIWRVSLRSRSEEYDVNAVARTFGGGGHTMAAAFRWRQEWNELEPKIIEALEKCVNEASEA